MMREDEVRSRICFANVLVRARRPENELSVALEDHPQNARRRSSLSMALPPKGSLAGEQQPSELVKRKWSSPFSWSPPE